LSAGNYILIFVLSYWLVAEWFNKPAATARRIAQTRDAKSSGREPPEVLSDRNSAVTDHGCEWFV